MTCMKKLESELIRYLQSDGFQKEFKSLKLSRDGRHPDLSKVRGSIETIFPYKTKTTPKIEERVASSVISHLSFTKTMASMYIMQPSDSLTTSYVSSAIRDAMNVRKTSLSNPSYPSYPSLSNPSLSYPSYPSLSKSSYPSSSKPSYPSTTLYDDVCQEYKHIWHSAQVIQKSWRRCISDPAYSMCRNRLKREFDEMVGG